MLKFRSLLCLVLGAAILGVPAQAAGERITGTIQVIDGDTFDVGGTRVRLFGIDAPEGDQTCTDERGATLRCGSFVTTQVRDAYRGKQAVCKQIDTDRYGRSVARCVVGNVDVGQSLVASGLAFAFAEYSRDYIAVEKAAIRAGRGIHAYTMVRPSEFRAQKRDTQTAAAKTPAQVGQNGCTIKGNISAKGVRIFHVAGQRDYQRTSIRTDKGERWFCSASEARAAGWRAARR
ncbi:thermonuclease family protein [uncultured Sulfitobacter sp.]|uniref:thermonuclease family protein n=1 Tax=uncultured Sulfitobacter sp. TaxID=191468 RepID=UPI0030DD7147|tara:strand:+ start:69602 stop:70300 length:699 start_codon:yes stop_codon:yes gene_type:complete